MDLLRHLMREDWRHLRRHGRDRFVWRERVLKCGLPFGVSFTAWKMYTAGYTWADVASVRGLALTYYLVALSVVLTYVEGRLEWRRRERDFRAGGGR
jgi:hypothetical protein